MTVELDIKTSEIKKPQSLPLRNSKEKENSAKQVQEFLSGIKTEFNKISWTDYEDLKTYTKIVVGATFVCGIGLYCADLLIQGVLVGMGSVIRFIFG